MFGLLTQKFTDLFAWLGNRARLTTDDLSRIKEQVQDALVAADVPYIAVEQFLAHIMPDLEHIGTTPKGITPGQQAIKVVHDRMVSFLGGIGSDVPTPPLPYIMMFMGLQGSGKTTTIGKIAHKLLVDAQSRKKVRRILVASVDFYRPAAIVQLEINARTVGVDFYRARADAVAAALDEILAHYKQHGYDILLLDTAGRLQLDEAMMHELALIKKRTSPKQSVLVLDAMMGQESLAVAQAFDQHVGFDGAILSKMDGDARGGAAFAFRYVLKKPILFMGVGERIDDLESFVPERMASRILGMGDVVSLVEKAARQMPMSDTKSVGDLNRRLLDGSFSLDDFAQQLAMMGQLGSLSQLVQYVPGAAKISAADIVQGEQDLKKMRAIIGSMTRKERVFPQILDASRKKRIAAGSGTIVSDVNALLQKFEQTRQFARLVKSAGRFGKMFR